MSVGENIRKIRKEKGLTQKELANRLETTPQNLAQYENGKRKPKHETIEKIASALDVSVFDLEPSINELELRRLIDENRKKIWFAEDRAMLLERILAGRYSEEEYPELIEQLKRTIPLVNNLSSEASLINQMLNLEDKATLKTNAFSEMLRCNNIDFKPAKKDNVTGKLFSLDKKNEFRYFLTDAQAEILPEMSIEQIKGLIRSFDRQNKEE